MEIKFLGTGGAFDIEYGNSAAVVWLNGSLTLIDCGFTVLGRLIHTGLVEKIDRILITHLHDDHVGSLSGLILYRKHVLHLPKTKIIYPNSQFRDQLHRFLEHSLVKPENYVEFIPMDQTPEIGAIDTFGLHVEGMQTWAYYFQDKSESLVYSGDLGVCKPLFDAIEGFGLKDPLVFHEINLGVSISAHVHYSMLAPYLKQYRIFGYHCDPRNNSVDNPVPLVFNHKQYLV